MLILSRVVLTAAIGPVLSLSSGPGSDPERPEIPEIPPPPYEVDSHERMAHEAVDRSVNWGHFLDDMGLRGIRYSRKFPNMAHAAFPNLLVGDARAKGLVAAGAILEDTPLTVVLRHFDDPNRMRGIRTPLANVRARDWAFNGGTKTNAWDWMSTLDYFEKAVLGKSKQERKDNQENLFVGIGHVIHLLEDEYQPGHTRLDAHAGLGLSGFQTVSPLEKWGIVNFNLNTTTQDLRQPVANATSTYHNTFMQFFATAGTFSNTQFFSEDTIYVDHPLPSTATTRTRTEPPRTEPLFGQKGLLKFVTSTSLNDPLTGRPMRMAQETRGFFAAFSGPSYTFASPGGIVVEDQAQVLIPRAIEASAGLIDHFFRGRFRMNLDDMNRLEITNTSDTSVTNASNLAFSNGQFRLAYETIDGTLIPLPAPLSPITVPGMLQVGETHTSSGDIVKFLDGKRDMNLPDSMRAREDRRVVALFRGTIGREEGVAASRITFANNISLLLSFDTSGSISSSQLAAARNSALTLFPILSSGANNRVSIQRFSSSASIVQAFTDDLTAARSAVQGLTRGGSTALHDAMVLAGTQATAEAMAQPMNRIFVVLFTDGVENSSSATAAQAAAALNEVAHPEQDEVFLVFVGSSSDGRAALQSLAAQANRRFISLSNFNELTTVFINVIQM